MADRLVLEGYDQALATLEPSIVRKAGKRAIGIVLKSGRTEASAQIRQIWNIKKGELDPRISLVNVSALSGTLVFNGEGISAAYFDAVQFLAKEVAGAGKPVFINSTRRVTKKSDRTKTRIKGHAYLGVKTTVKIGRPKALPGAFLARMSSGHVGVFHRISDKMMRKKKKQAIGEKGVVSIATMFKQPKVYAAFVNKIYVQWRTVFPHELEQERRMSGGS